MTHEDKLKDTEPNLRSAAMRVAARLKCGLVVYPSSFDAKELVRHADAYRALRGGDLLSVQDLDD